MDAMTGPSLLQGARAASGAYLATLERLVTLESPSRDKPLTDRLADSLSELLAEDGWALERHARAEVGDILEARQPGRDADDGSLLLAHTDTVWPQGTLQAMPFRQDGDRVAGPGILDMKAGIASAIHALRLLRAEGLEPRGPVTLLATTDEETGSHHSRALIERLARSHARVLVLEPGREDGALKIGRKGVGQIHLALHGISAHAGNNPQDGASALRELAHLLLYAEDLAGDAEGTTVNLTVARGGTTGNVIAEAAEADVDLRVVAAAEADRVMQALAAYRARDERVRVTVSGGLNRPPLERTPGNDALWQEAQRLGASLGLVPKGALVGGGSDGCFTSALGVPTLDGMGAVGAGPHARHEHIRLAETLERVALLSALLAGHIAPS